MISGADEASSHVGRIQGLMFVLLGGVFVFVLLSLFCSGGRSVFAVSLDKIAFRFGNISIISGFSKRFGWSALIDFLLKIFKSFVIGGIFVMMAFPDEKLLGDDVRFDGRGISGVIFYDLFRILFVFCGCLALFGVVDYFVKRMLFYRKNMMTRKEILDEQKDVEGDPIQKGERRRRAVNLSQSSIKKMIEGASVVLVNPTHFSVVLAWSRSDVGAPRCVAKGTDEVALQIRFLAKQMGIPVRSDPPTARLLYGCVKVGDEVPREFYAAVAIAIRFAEDVRKRYCVR